MFRAFDSQNRKLADITTLNETVTYIQSVIMPVIFNNGPSAHDLTGPADDQTYHFVYSSNYVCGMRLTIKKAKLIQNTDPISSAVFAQKRAEIYTTAENTYSSENTDPIGNYTYTYKGSFRGKGGYVIYFPGNISQMNARLKFQDLVDIDMFIPIETISLTLELLFYNANYETGLYVALSFLEENAGTITYKETVNGFQPEVYDSFHSATITTVILILQIAFQFFIYLDLIKLILRFVHHGIDLVTGKKIYIPSSDFVGVIVNTFCIASLIYWYIHIIGRK